MASFLKLPITPYSPNPNPKPKPINLSITCSSLPARDKIIDFGKYKGRMLGTLPSIYLKWVSTNLRAHDFEEWAYLADQVLEDPVYNDRVEWEYADKLLNGNALAGKSKSLDSVSELIEISQRFGWDNEDKIGWSKIDFQILGTSNGGRIPRVKEKAGNVAVSTSEGNVDGGGMRVGRRERLRGRRSVVDEREENGGEDEGRRSGGGGGGGETGVYNPFPGRETLLKKVLNRRKMR